jgi:hypothetical protein
VHEQLCASAFEEPPGAGDSSAHDTSRAVSFAGCGVSERLLIRASLGGFLGAGDGDAVGSGDGEGEEGLGEGDVTGSGDGLC